MMKSMRKRSSEGTIFGPTGLKAFRVLLASMLIDRAEGVTTSEAVSHWTWTKVVMASVLMLMILLPVLFALMTNAEIQDEDKDHQRREPHGSFQPPRASTSTLMTSANQVATRRRKQENVFPEVKTFILCQKDPQEVPL